MVEKSEDDNSISYLYEYHKIDYVLQLINANKDRKRNIGTIFELLAVCLQVSTYDLSDSIFCTEEINIHDIIN